MIPRVSIVPGVTLFRGWLTRPRADEFLAMLWAELEWRQDSIRIMGRLVPQPRLTSWCSDPGVQYTYSGLSLGPSEWHPGLFDLRRRVEDELGQSFNSVLINAYRDGRDSMGWHADDEAELGPRPCIASVSLGATRRFLLREKASKSKPRKSTGIDLSHGDLLVMADDSQSKWQHSLARTRTPVGLRLNLTFRKVSG